MILHLLFVAPVPSVKLHHFLLIVPILSVKLEGVKTHKLAPVDLIKVTNKDSSTNILKIHSCSGKATATGIHAHSWNVTDASGTIRSLNLKKDILLWDFIATDVTSHEFISAQFYQAQVSDDIYEAKMKELSGRNNMCFPQLMT